MSVTITDLIADLHDVRDVLRIMASFKRDGALRLSSAGTNAVVTFRQGHITAAYVLSDGTRGVPALERILQLPNASSQFVLPSDMPASHSEHLWVDIKLVLSHDLRLEGISTDPLLTTSEQVGAPQAELATKPPTGRPFPPPPKISTDSMLSDAQKDLLEVNSRLADWEAFLEPDRELREQAERLAKEKSKLLNAADLDARPFDDQENVLPTSDERILTEEQKVLLSEVKKLGDVEAFLDPAVAIEQTGTVMSDESRWMLEQVAQALTPEQQVAQFVSSDPDLVDDGTPDFKVFVEVSNETTGDVDVDSLDAIAGAKVLTGDRLSTTASRADLSRIAKENQGIIGRFGDAVLGRMPSYTGPRRVSSKLELILGPTVLGCLIVLALLVPIYLRNSLNAQEAALTSDDEVKSLMEEDTQYEVPYVSTEYADGFGKDVRSGVAPSSSSENEEKQNRVLAEARSLSSKGWSNRAAKAYRIYLQSNPRALDVWIELVELYIKDGNLPAARQTCLDALKQDGIPPGGKERLWALLNRCL